MQETNQTISPDGLWLWNGTEWVPNPANTMAGAVAPEAPVSAKPKKNRLGLKITGGILAALLAFGFLSSLGGNDTSAGPASPDTASTQSDVQDDAAQAPAEKDATENKPAPEVVEEEAPEMTRSQENAIRSAESYLDLKGFSRQGLIEQLSSEYGEGFSKKDATFAVDYLEDTDAVDWNAEAVESAESYLDLKGFSRQGLIEQLESEYGDGFTHKQAVYAVNQVGL